jgi:FixJ family two-component response regulator
MNAPSTAPRHLAICEDDPDIAELIAEIVSGLGHQVSTYHNPVELLAQLARADAGMPHAILTDLHMPGMSGMELLTKLRSAGNNIPVVLQTGNSDFAFMIDAIRLGATDFLLKPSRPPEIELVVQRALDVGYNLQVTAQILTNLKKSHPDIRDDIEQIERLARSETLMQAMNSRIATKNAGPT